MQIQLTKKNVHLPYDKMTFLFLMGFTNWIKTWINFFKIAQKQEEYHQNIIAFSTFSIKFSYVFIHLVLFVISFYRKNPTKNG